MALRMSVIANESGEPARDPWNAMDLRFEY
jgi:hypothetical protein